jgi:hypothetical protein
LGSGDTAAAAAASNTLDIAPPFAQCSAENTPMGVNLP